jgi:hypothetical protein
MDLALLAPGALLLLMLLLGRLERWLDASTPPPQVRPPRRWHRTPRAVRPTSIAVGAGRRLLAHRPRSVVRRRPGAAGASVAVPRAARRHLLGGRPRSDH